MKVLYIIGLTLTLASCKKEETPTPTTSRKVFMRVESVGQDGASTYSPIIVTNIK